MKKVFSLALVCLLLFSLCGCFEAPKLVESDPDVKKQTEATTTPTTPAKDQIYKLGDSVEYKNVTIKFSKITESNGSEYNKPATGNVFILCEFEITNNSKEDLAISSIMSFSAYCDDYTISTSFSALLEKGNVDQLDGSIAAGKKMKGVLGYEIPSDWKELEIQYQPDLLSDTKIVFTTTNN